MLLNEIQSKLINSIRCVRGFSADLMLNEVSIFILLAQFHSSVLISGLDAVFIESMFFQSVRLAFEVIE